MIAAVSKKTSSPAGASLIVSTAILWATSVIAFGVIFFHERLQAIVLVGAATIIATAAILYVRDYNVKKGTLVT